MINDHSVALEKLRAFKSRVLDLTRRNSLINSRFSSRGKRHFRIIDEIPQQIYEKLSESPMSFEWLPAMSTDPTDEQTPEFQERLSIALLTDTDYLEGIENSSEDESRDLLRELKNKIREDLGMAPYQGENISIDDHARNQGINPSYDLQDASEGNVRHEDNKLQTLFLEDDLESFLNKLSRDFKSSQKERGVNPLYFCFGFLKWKESEFAEDYSYAPLLMLQVQFDESAQGARIKVSSTGDELILNQSIKEKIKQSFNGPGLPELPELGEDETYHNLTEYFQTVENFAYEKGWSLKKWVSFGLYDAQYMPVFRDIENIAEDLNDRFDLLKEFLEGGITGENQNNSAEVYDVDSEECQNEITALVTDADSSQFSAVRDAVNGKNIVLKGPPGTGKSQTITNIISSLIANGKKVLFVAEKQAALDVVRNNLEAIGSEDYLLEIFSVKANKKAVMESIRNRSQLDPPTNPNGLNQKIDELNNVKKELNEYSDFINIKYGETEKTLHEILWDQANEEDLAVLNEFNFDTVTIEAPERISELNLEQDEISLENIINMINQNFRDVNINESPLRKNKFRQRLTTNEIQIFKNEVRNKGEKFINAFEDTKDFLIDRPELAASKISQILKRKSLEKWKRSDNNSPIKLIFSILLNLDRMEDMNLYLRNKSEYDGKHADFVNTQHYLNTYFHYDQENSLYDLEEIKNASKELKNSSFLSWFNKEWRKSRKLFFILKKASINKKLSGKECGEHLERLYVFQKNKASNKREISSLKQSLNDQLTLFQAFEEQISEETLINKRDFIENAIKDLKKIDRSFLSFWRDRPEEFNGYYDLIENLSETHKNFEKALDDHNFTKLITKKLPKISDLEEDIEIVKTLIQHLQFLREFNELKTIEGLLQGRLKDFYDAYTNSGASIDYIRTAYKHLIRQAQKNHIEENYRDKLAEYSGTQIESLRIRLKRLDEEVMEMYRQKTSKQIHSSGRYAPPGISTGRVRDKREMGLIRHLANVSNPRMSLREFIKNSQKALTCLKPCSLMSPLTVSTALPLEETFDAVIIDEASQMKPEYAIGAIARAKQAIIVGDPQQLPPSTFYQTALAEDEFDDDLADESILDMAMTVIHPPRQLLWHYRSRHEDLIKFSNTKFYNNELMVPVTANPDKNNRGILYNFIEDGRYISGAGAGSGGINPNEAKAIVEAAIDFMNNRKEESLGIATMNIKQKEFIQNEFDLRAANDNSIREYLSYWQDQEEGLEEFFIKNLENVQGDERDVIMISTVYGREENQARTNQRFGPINGKYGARRLNVLFTRAKNELQLFTSLKPNDITIDENSSKGKEILRDYLIYAETGFLQEVEENSHEVESPFQQWAIDVINSFPGYEAIHEIGVKGYRIDIGVKHEDYPYGFIMAVETDGASYHSQRSARDRDKLRQEILEGYGWVFHRIWSTDWLNNRAATRERLREALDNRLREALAEAGQR
tara:strand:+ start:461 stop:4849 length:4389 start_codon:yes stop_codon:yes gene_type:complete